MFAVAAATLVALTAGCGGGHSGHRGQAAQREGQPDAGRNVVRLGGKSGADVAGAALLALYPDRSHQPGGLVVVSQDDWRQAAVAAQFAASPLDGAIVPTAHDFLPAAPNDVITRLTPSGFPRAQGLQALVIGRTGRDVLASLQNENLHLTELSAPTAEQLEFKAIPFRGGWAHSYSDEVVVVSSQARDYALPAMAWSAYSGDTLAFVTHGGVPDATRKTLVQRQKLRLNKPTIYVIGPPSVIPDGVLKQLSAYGPVKRVAGNTPAANSVALARFKDPKTGFGWGFSSAPANVSLVNVHDWQNAFGALAFAAAGPHAPLLLTDSPTTLPQPVVSYLRGIRGRTASQGFVFGGPASIGERERRQLAGDLAASGG